MKFSQRMSRWTVIGMFLVLGWSLWADGEPGRPTRLAIEPNAILRNDQPLEIEIGGIPKGERARVWVVQDCDGDGRPDDDASRPLGGNEGGEHCPRLYDGESEPADVRLVARHRLDFSELDINFPRGVKLWLRSARPGSERFRQALFAFVDEECSIFATLIDTFLHGECSAGLAQVLRRHRQPTDLENTVFEVRRLVVDASSSEPVPVPGTRGASGVAWLDHDTLLVTAEGLSEPDSLKAGLYRVPLAPEAEPEVLWRPAAGAPGPVAPLDLGRGRVAFVRQEPGAQPSGAGLEVARLTVLRLKGRTIEHEVALPYKVHQLLAADKKGTSVLALSLGVADNQPVLMVVKTGRPKGRGAVAGDEVEVVGFANALYQSAMREPGGTRSVVAFENAFAGRGWQLVLAEGSSLTRDLVKRDAHHDLGPSWRPRGGELVYLAQVGEVR